MKPKIFLRLLTTCIALALFLSSCFNKNKELIQVDPAFGAYISGYTSGVISVAGTIRIELTEDYFGTEKNKLRSDNPENLFHFEPAIKGKTKCLGARTIEFTPDEHLISNTPYIATFALNKLMKVPDKLEIFRFQFVTVQQYFEVVDEGLSIYNSKATRMEKLTGYIKTRDIADTASARKILTAEQNGKKLKIRWENYSYDNQQHFTVDSILRTDKEGKVTLTWDGGPLNVDYKGSRDIVVAALGDFKVTDVKVVQGPDQSVTLQFSDPLLVKQNLDGIVTIDGVQTPTFSINESKVIIYLPERVVGTKIIHVSTGIKNFRGYKMNHEEKLEETFDEPKPLVRLVGKGNILPNSNGLLFPFEAIGLKAIDVRVMKIYQKNIPQFLQVNDLKGSRELTRVAKTLLVKKIDLNGDKKMNLKRWNHFSFDLSKLISPEPGAIYRVEIRFNKKYALCDCPDDPENANAEEGDLNENPAPEGNDWTEENWQYSNYYENYFSDYEDEYAYNYEACDENYYYGKGAGSNILASDIGIINKMGEDHTANVFINNLVTTQPIAACNIEFYDYQQQLIASTQSDASGMATVKLSKKPFLLIAKYGKQRGYLKLEDGASNSLSKFSVSGQVVQKGVKGFIYGERGVWRPGDSLFLSFMLEDKQRLLPSGHPVIFELINPEEQVVQKIIRTKSLDGLYDFRTKTDDNAVTGNWMAKVSVGNRVFTERLKIETVKPNRLKIYLDFGKQMISHQDTDATGTLQVKWLHGAVAKNLKTKIDVTVNQANTTFDNYSGYVFDSPLRSYYSEQETVFEDKVDENGKAEFPTNLQVADAAPGMLRAYFTTKVFEEGGDFSVDRYSVLYSPYSSYVGLSVPSAKSTGGLLETDVNHQINVATVTAEGKPVSRKNLNLKVYHMEWRWWWENGEDDMADYLARNSTSEILDSTISTVNGKGKFNFRVNRPNWGRYLVVVTDPESGHSTGQIITVDWPYWARINRTDKENATMLNFSCDKDKYTTGEPVKITIPTPSDGKALVCVESGTKVLKKFWIDTKKGETRYEFPATEDMAPNAYLHVTLMQPHSKTSNDLPIRLYGVIPVLVENPETHLHPVLTTQDVMAPESLTTISVKEKKGKAMNYTIAIVDEGLLDLTRFKTPEPWNTFYAREALGVKTWDIYDMVLGAYSGKMDKMLSIGGDGENQDSKATKANRFKPMVKFIGPFHLNAGQTASHKIQLPNYVGSVRVMVVGGMDGAYGNSEKTVPVRKPLMVLATLPRVLGPGESVSLPVNVFAMEKQVKDVKVEVEYSNIFKMEGYKQQTIHFKEIGDEVVNFKLSVAEKTGVGKVKITATSGKEKAVYEIEIAVRTPNPEVTDIVESIIEPGKSWNPTYAFKGMVGTNKGTLELSSVPPLDLQKHMSYLIQYPHGCIEQTTSSVFPQLFVSNLTELSDKQKAAIAFNIKQGIKRLQLFQTGAGGFSYWPGEGETSEWGSNYGGHFILEAEKKGYTLPANMKTKWTKYQQKMAREWIVSNNSYTHPHGTESYQLIQAYRLYTLALVSAPELGAMNRLREEKNLSLAARWRLAAAYQLAGQAEVARELVNNVTTDVQVYKELSYSYGSDVRDKAMILEALSIMNNRAKALPLAQDVSRAMSKMTWMSTQEAAYCLVGMSKFIMGNGTSSLMKISYSFNNETEIAKSTTVPVLQLKMEDKDISKSGKLSVQNNGIGVLYAKLILQGIPVVGDQSAASNNLSLEVKYTTLNGTLIDPEKIIQGTDFVADVTIKNPGLRGELKEMTLNQIFPSGWEIHNTRMDDNVAAHAGDAPRYQDIRDDRVYTYYDMAPFASKHFKILLNATYLGRFYLPTIESEAMYDHTINARVPGKWVEVVSEPATVASK